MMPAGNPADEKVAPDERGEDKASQDRAEIHRIGVERFGWGEYDRQTNPTDE